MPFALLVREMVGGGHLVYVLVARVDPIVKSQITCMKSGQTITKEGVREFIDTGSPNNRYAIDKGYGCVKYAMRMRCWVGRRSWYTHTKHIPFDYHWAGQSLMQYRRQTYRRPDYLKLRGLSPSPIGDRGPPSSVRLGRPGVSLCMACYIHHAG